MQGLVLVGPPGAGKSTLLPRLGRSLHRSTLDTDIWIHNQHKEDLAELAEERGERFLVDEESRCLRSYDLSLFVVATSGSVIWSDTKDYLRASALVVWIDVPPEETLAFLESDTSGRIVVGEGDLLENLRSRQDFYADWSHFRVARENKSRKEIAEEITNIYKREYEN